MNPRRASDGRPSARPFDAAQRWVAPAYVVLGVALVIYLFWLLLKPDAATSTLLDGWMIDGLELSAAALAIVGALQRRRGRTMALFLGAAIASWAIGDVALTVESLHGATPPVPSVADLFYLLFYPLMYVGVVLFLRMEVRGLSLSSWLDGIVAGLGAAALCGVFAFRTVLHLAGGTKLAVATDLAYPIGDLLLLGLVVGGTVVLTRGRKLPWFLLAAGIGLNVVGDTFNLFSDTAFGSGRVGSVLNGIAWPAAIVLISASVWVRARPAASGRPQRHIGFVLPGVAAAVALVILTVGSLRNEQHVAVWLATATLAAAGVRLMMTTSELRRLTEQRHQQAITDELTGLGNRRFLAQVLDDFFAARSDARQAGSDERMAFLFVDLNHFKEVNDSFGHPAGDDLLAQLGPRMLAALREKDAAVRLGGDEFGVVVLDAGREEAELVAHRLLTCLENPYALGAVEAKIGASIGIALVPDDATDSTAIVRCADVAMYRAKLSGVPIAQYDSTLDDEGSRWALAMDLRQALPERQFVLHYQPQLDLRSGRVVALEALLRWMHPDRGLVPPLQFLPLAEEIGLMGDLTAWVLDESLAQCAKWRTSGRAVSVSVNISPSDLLSKNFSGVVRSLTDRHGVPPEALVLEITETSIISDFERARKVIDNLVELGFCVSIDDFGAGFTSLAHLNTLRVQELKMDQSFITRLGTPGDHERELHLVRSTLELGHALGLRVVAEGIEDAGTLQLLSDLGCDLAQGYFISKPKPAEDLALMPSPLAVAG